MMRDVGKFMNYQGHHRHAQYIIANSEIFGFTRRSAPSFRPSRATWANPARTRKTAPCGTVPPEEHEPVKRAVVLLRLAVALNQDRASDVLR